MNKKKWMVVRDFTGHYQAIVSSFPRESHSETIVIETKLPYLKACKIADGLNAVKEVTES